MANDRSAANPAKLSQYATDGTTMAYTLGEKATALTTALDKLDASSSQFLRSTGSVGSDLTDLAGDWFHLDEFAGDTAAGFIANNQAISSRGRAISTR